jgi:hypothetical protein
MNIETIKALFEEMRKSGIQFFEHTAPSGESHKIIMNPADSTEAVGIRVDAEDDTDMGFDTDSISRSGNLYENRTLKLKDFTN